MRQRDAGIDGSKLPIDRGVPSVAIVQPCIDLRPHGLLIGNATVEAPPAQDAEFNFRNVEPAAVLGCVVDPEPLCDGPCPVVASAPRGGLDMPMPGQGLDFEEGLGDAVADVFVLPALGLAAGDRELAAQALPPSPEAQAVRSECTLLVRTGSRCQPWTGETGRSPSVYRAR